MSKNQSDSTIFCTKCGKANDKNANFCSKCGAKLISGKSESSQSGKPKGQAHNKPAERKLLKKISPKQVAAFIGLLFAVGILNLYVAGLFDSAPDVEDQVKNAPKTDNANVSSGVDLNQLQQINDLEEKVKKNPNDHESLLTLAHLYNDSGFNEKAIDRYKLYLSSHPDNADVWVDMGVCYFDLQNFEDAISCMNKGISLVPNHQTAHFNLGIIQYSMHNIETAKEWWQKAYDIDPNSAIGKKAKELIDNN